MSRSMAAIAAIGAFVLSGPAFAELPTQQILPLAVAQKAADACIALAAKNGWAVSVTVRDSGDDLLLFERMDNAGLETVDLAREKASTAARFGAPTSALGSFAFDKKTKAPSALAFLPNVSLLAGGLPIQSAKGEFLGAIGVSGVVAVPNGDETCAKAGLDAIQDDLK